MAKNEPNSKTADKRLVDAGPGFFPLKRKNFIFMAIAGIMIVAGFLLMTGSGSTVESFNVDIFSWRRIVAGPTIALLGFVFMGFGIMWKPKNRKSDR